jgi:hypothetical protein
MSTESDTTTPARYHPDDRDYEDKAWLYSRYWGAMQSCPEIAAERDVSARHVRRAMDELGIPRRSDSYRLDNDVGIFDGFYDDGDSPGNVGDDEVDVDWSECR